MVQAPGISEVGEGDAGGSCADCQQAAASVCGGGAQLHWLSVCVCVLTAKMVLSVSRHR